MPTDIAYLLASTAVFAAVFLTGLVRLRHGGSQGRLGHLIPMAVAFALQTGFLYVRGQYHGRCPITSVLEVLLFLCWAMVLLYFLAGPAFHLSLLGWFTSPVVVLIQGGALFMPGLALGKGMPDFPAIPDKPIDAGSVNALLETHAGLSLIAYGAFGLAAVAGVMFLLQDYLLKHHRIRHMVFALEPVELLGRATGRILVVGWLLLTAGLALAFFMERSPTSAKLGVSVAVWILYGLLLLLLVLGKLTPRQLARASVLGFVLPIVTLWLVTGP